MEPARVQFCFNFKITGDFKLKACNLSAVFAMENLQLTATPLLIWFKQ